MNVQSPNTHSTRTKLLRLPEVMALTGIRSTAIYDAIQKGQFPAPVKLGRASAWVEHEVHGWITARMEERDSAA